MADLQIRTTVTANSIQRLFGPPAINYRSHPNQREPDNPSIIFNAMKNKEIAPLPDIKILKGTVYSFKNRKIITRWIRDVCAAFNLKSSTLCLAVQLTDAFIISNLSTLQVAQCQLVAVVGTWIAAKFEEMDDVLPSLKALTEVCDGAYSAQQILEMEEQVLEGFRWRLPHSTCLNFLYLYLHMHGNPAVARQILELRNASSATAAQQQQQQQQQQPQTSSALPLGPSPTALSFMPPKSGHVAVQIIVVADPNTKQRTYIPAYLPATTPFSEMLKDMCAYVRLHYTAGQMEVFELAGVDFLLARRVPLQMAPAELGMRGGNASPVKLFISTSAGQSGIIGGAGGTNNNNNNSNGEPSAAGNNASANNASGAMAAAAAPPLPPPPPPPPAAPSGKNSSVFAETDDIVILRTVNGLALHMADVLASEVITHVEFLRLPSHVVALGVVALSRCLTATTNTTASGSGPSASTTGAAAASSSSPSSSNYASSASLNEIKAVLMFIIKSLGISASQSLAAAELLKDKYKEALGSPGGPVVNADGTTTIVPPTPCVLLKPVVDIPSDISERLRFVFGK